MYPRYTSKRETNILSDRREKHRTLAVCLLITLIILISGCISSQEGIISKAQETKDVSLCDKLSDANDKEHCIANVAIETRNPKLCEGLQTEFNGQIAGISANGKYSDICFSAIAKEIYDYKLCKKMTDGWSKDDCFDTVAKFSKNKDICNEISDSTTKQDCIKTVSEFAPGYCESLSDAEKDCCIFRRATWSNNLADCENIGSATGAVCSKESCRRNIPSRN